MGTTSVNNTKVIEASMGMWNTLLRLNVLRQANHEEDQEYYNDINEVVHSIFKIAIQARQLKQDKEGDDTTNENYDDYKEEIIELIKQEIAYLQKEHPNILLNMPINLFDRLVQEVLQDKDTMNVAVLQYVNMLTTKENAIALSNAEGAKIGDINNIQETTKISTTGGIPIGNTAPIGNMLPTNGKTPINNMSKQFPTNTDTYPQKPDDNQEASIIPPNTPEEQKVIDEINKQTDGHFKKQLNSFTKNGIHPQIALVATNTGALLAGMLIPGAGFLFMTVALKANLEILPKWPKKKLIPAPQNWFEEPDKNEPDKNEPKKNEPDKDEPSKPNNPQQQNKQNPQYNGLPNNTTMPNGMMPQYGGAPNVMNGMVNGVTQAGAVGIGTNSAGFKKPLQIWETVAANLVHNNRIKTETKLTYYIDKDGKIYINSKEYGIKSDKEYIELTTENLQDYLMFIAEKNGLGETESMKEFIDQVSKIAKGEIGIKEINNGIVGVMDASTKLSKMMNDDKLSNYGKKIYNELLLKKIENLVEFDPQKPIEEEIIKQLEETQKILIEKLTSENLEKLNDEEKEQFTQMLNGVSSTLNMAKIYQGVKLIEEKEREIDLLKDKKKLNELYTRRNNNNKQEKELNESNNAIQEEKKKLYEQIKNEQEKVNELQEIVNLQTKRDDLERQFEKELEALYDSLGRSKEILGDDMIDDGLIEQIENKIKERDKQLQEIDTQLQEKGINSQEARESLQQHQDNLNKLKQQQTDLEIREEENNEKITTITESKEEIDKEIKQYEDRVKTKQTDIEKELEQSKQKKLNKLQKEKKEVEKLKKEKEEIEASKKELDELILKKRKEIELMKLDKPYMDTEEVNELDKKLKESQTQLDNLIQQKQNKEIELKKQEQELKQYRTSDEIENEINNKENQYKKHTEDLENTNYIEEKQKEVIQQKQNIISKELIFVQQQILQNSQFSGLKKVLNINIVDVPKYQPPIIHFNKQEQTQKIIIE